MGLLIDIKKIHETELEAIYCFCTIPEGNSGKVSINKTTGSCSLIEEPKWDIESELAARVKIKLLQHWRKGEFPETTCWAS